MRAFDLPTQPEIDAQIELATQTRVRYGYSVPAVVVLSGLNEASPKLGFFFEAGRQAGELSSFDDGLPYFILAVVK